MDCLYVVVLASDHDRAEYHEGPDAAQRFDGTMRRVLTVTKDELAKREAASKKSRLTKNRRRARSIVR